MPETPLNKLLYRIFPGMRPISDNLNNKLVRKIEKALSSLNFRERRIINLRCGLTGKKISYTQKEVGNILHVTPERVWQIEIMALRKLQCRLLED